MVVAIYGLGLIGGSIGRTLVKKTDFKVIGKDVDESRTLKALVMNAIHEEIDDNNIKTADVVVLAVCPGVAISIMNDILPKLKNGCTVTDCCGNKKKIVEAMDKHSKIYKNIGFVGMHPMAGREFSGIEHSTTALFDHAYFIITPVHTPIENLLTMKEMITALNCDGIVLSNPEKHDKIISYTSQLAHIVSSSYIKNPLSAEHFGFSAGSFRDMTRVAKLNPDMWTELFLDNRENLLEQINDLEKHLNEYKKVLENNDAEGLKNLLAEGSRMKEQAEALRRQGAKNA